MTGLNNTSMKCTGMSIGDSSIHNTECFEGKYSSTVRILTRVSDHIHGIIVPAPKRYLM